ncbi:paraquat-inducible protein A [Bdellovibrio bacteriovorus]|uniref:Paraquat-inducible protein A n=1 Tax=Bdellovibrio bacteriovorus str. Tiberius TaxID=1069642 RepID=K7YT81_BDEBC|nr:paraquat-inducible protein A [Bdellovibrio bacteriovorus]AFY00838.1 paraquat-inducible protein A [Bdellovibrio bacteriovorus str. Tiberius]
MNTQSQQLTLAFSITALVLYIPANLLPFMSIELYGRRNTATIWDGIVSLAEAGSWPIAIIVFLASILIPLLKLVILFYLSLGAADANPQLQDRLYRIVEAIGRWSMLDIFLLAIMIAILKLGKWATVEPKPGALLFALVVIFTMLASAYFERPACEDKERHGQGTETES